MNLKEIKQLFNQEGLRFTTQRKHLIEILIESEKPLHAEDIFLAYVENDQSVSLSTVYRILELLVEKDLVSKTFMTAENKAYYTINQGHKHYITCLNCKKMIEFGDCPIHDIEKELKKETNFIITRHKLEFYGLCPECQS